MPPLNSIWTTTIEPCVAVYAPFRIMRKPCFGQNYDLWFYNKFVNKIRKLVNVRVKTTDIEV